MMNTVEVLVQVAPEGQMPVYSSSEAAGMDLCASAPVELGPGERKLVPTGLRMVIPTGYEGQVRPRSGLALKKGIGIVNAPGTIDSDYRGEIGVILINWSNSIVKLEKGERIAQMVVCPVTRAALREIPDVTAYTTERGEGGFGSTGTH
jgi:dUTP pyrophosphatase